MCSSRFPMNGFLSSTRPFDLPLLLLSLVEPFDRMKCISSPKVPLLLYPYLNTDAETVSPFEHGEVFVLDDGGEVDLDLGNYERLSYTLPAFGDCRALEHPSRALAPSLTQPSIASSGSRRSLPQCTGFLEMNWLLDGFITAGEGAKCCASEVLLAIAALAMLFVDDPWLRPTFRSKAFGDCRALEHPSRALAPSLTQPSIASSGSRRSLPQCTGFLEMNWLLDGFITAGEGAKCCASEVLLAIAALAMLFVDDPWLRPTFRSKVIL
ncbi:hypothetical protein ZIOFF_032149 [Zingiber officinale]|uniref:CTP synthase N-terminal domain-containing protein n=1 Tax=Zingiber officinale TaxID=94328 RepID=A0A8J5GFV8_ZINOF|nr:hypothetical protein ZIOFF_032149 [Zingiber officinale]